MVHIKCQLSKSFMVEMQSLTIGLIKPNFHASLSYWRSTTVSLESRNWETDGLTNWQIDQLTGNLLMNFVAELGTKLMGCRLVNKSNMKYLKTDRLVSRKGWSFSILCQVVTFIHLISFNFDVVFFGCCCLCCFLLLTDIQKVSYIQLLNCAH